MDMLFEWCESEKLEWDEKSKTAYGYYEGFPIAVKSKKGTYSLCLFCKKEKSDNCVESNSKLLIEIPREKSPSLMYISVAAGRLCRKAREEGLTAADCEKCGGTEVLRVWEIKGEYTVSCINCREMQSDEERAVVIEHMPEKGNVIGALIGAFFAIIFYTIVYQLGSFAPFGGAAAALFICVGYSKGGNFVSKKSLMLCIQFGFFSLLIAQATAIWLTLYMSYFWQGIGFWQIFELMPRFLAMPGVMRAAMSDILIAVIPMTLINIWWYLRQKKRGKA